MSLATAMPQQLVGAPQPTQFLGIWEGCCVQRPVPETRHAKSTLLALTHGEGLERGAPRSSSAPCAATREGTPDLGLMNFFHFKATEP